MRRLNAEDYTIGWISPLSTELAASMAMLDEEHLALPTTPSDHNIYTLGRVGQHNIVMAGLPAGLLGPSSAASVAAKMRTSFPWIRFGLLVGIAGGAPSPDKDVRLGDVVVSQPMEQSGGVVQFDSGTIVEGKLVRSGSLNAPPTILLSAITWLTAKHMSKTNDFVRHLNTVLDAVHSDFTYPNVEDQLFESSYEHEGGDTCVNCDIRRLVPRIPRPNPTVHYGLIASANRVIQDGLERDKLGKEFNVLCFEMEAAGLMNEFPCIVIRGISDYADSHKNEIWQRYAATTAAVYAKELLCTIAERVPNSTMLRQDPNQGVSISLDPDSNPLCVVHEPSEDIYNFSRERILDGTLEWLIKDRNITRALSSTTAEKQIVCLRGPPRSGKSCAASYLIDHVRQRNDRKSTIAYYFFSAANGMTSVRDALTAIVYQLQQQFDFLQEERTVVSRHVSRYRPNVKPVPRIRLIENGLGPYLTQSRVNVYLVIDGIDEADLYAKDPVARDTSEMKIFLRYLYDLKSARTRVILISRPLQMLEQCIPNLTYSNIDFEESCRAIDYYVGQFIKKHRHVQEMFHKTGIVPVEYFRVNGNGVFPWVRNALGQLSTVKRLSHFQRLITNLPEDYSLLFDANARIFSNMDDEDKNEVKTIIYHLELSRKPMMLMILRPMVEASLGPEVCRSPLKDESRDTFLNFLAQQCASFLRIDTGGGVIQADFVQFRHHSFQLFIHSDLGRDELKFEAQAIGTKEVLMALRKLTQYSKPPDELGGSCISWTDHLPMAETRGKKAAQILVAICRLFSSPTSIAVAIEWLTKLASSQEVDKLSPSTILMNSNPAVEKAITNIADWMRACRMDSTLIDQSELAKINKIKTLLSDDCLVAKAFGKWAMWVALWKPLRSIIDVKVMFGVAFNYYFRQSGHTNPGNVLRELIDRDFNGMVQWYDWHKPPEVENLGYVFSLLQQWERAIACYNTALQDSEDYALNVNLAEAYAKQGDHLNAVAQYKAAIANDFSFHHGCAYVAEIYRNRDDLKGFKQFAQDIGLDDHDELSFDDDTRISSMGVYMAAGDYHSAIRAFRDFDEIKILLNAYEKASYSDESIIDSLERILKVDPSRYVNLLYHFSNACQVHGYNDKAIEALRNGIQKRPRSRSDYVQLRLYLADVYMKSGRPDDAIDVLQEILNKYPDTVTAWTNLFDLLLSIRRLDDVIHGAERLCNTEEIKHSPAWFSCFYAGCAATGRALEQKGDLKATISAHEEALSSNPMFWKLWGDLCEFYNVHKDTGAGVAISRELLERLEEDRKGNAKKRRHQFGCDYLEDESGAKAERFALWYGLFHVLQVVWREKYCTMSDPDGWTALHIAAYGGYKDIVSFILGRGQCDTALTDRKGRTPLHIAAMEGHFEVVSQLLDFGFDVGAKDVLGFTALNLAIEADERDVEKILTRF